MAAAAAAATVEQAPEIFSWLKNLPLAPEYHPTLTEFQDPISYILKIEKEASKYGICKIVPPLPPPAKKTAIANLNRSLAARNPSSNPKSPPTFTTRQQQIGFCPRKGRPVQRPVWQSGESYTLQHFEAKAKQFEKVYSKKFGKKLLSPLQIETLFWKASVDKPLSVEYANDMPGSAFAPVNEKKWREAGETTTVGETAWNMRGVSRAKGSLLKFMKEEVPGVTSPMVYIAMMFSWFAWHVEDHDLHSLNYLHIGAGKTWYGVPKEAAVAFEEVIRVHGYGGEVNPLVTFAILGEKITVMSPEVLIKSGIPCCRLVQNAGEFVVTFPRAYHSGFSHGFNCGEAANIATPEWLMVAKEAAIRRASINYPPMVSHFHLLYALALTLCSRIPMSIGTEPRSSRLKVKKRGEGETMVKELFVQSVIQNNNLLHVLGKGTSCVILPLNSSDISLCSNLRVRAQLKVKPRLSLGLCSPEEALEPSTSSLSDDTMLDRNVRLRHLSGFNSVKGKPSSVCEQNGLPSLHGNANLCTISPETQKIGTGSESISQGDGLLDQGLFSCVTCGILSFACVAVIQPKEAAAHYLMSADCSFFNDWTIGSGIARDRYNVANEGADTTEPSYGSGRVEESVQDGLYDVPVQSGEYHVRLSDENAKVLSDPEVQKGISSLDLLASTYGNTSDSEDQDEPEMPIPIGKKELQDYSFSSNQHEWIKPDYGRQISSNCKNRSQQNFDCRIEVEMENQELVESKNLEVTFRDPMATSRRIAPKSACIHQSDVKWEKIECSHADYSMSSNSSRILNCSPVGHFAEATKFWNADISFENTSISLIQRSDDDSSRMHIFCLEHAVEVEKQLRPIGGVHMLLLCHPEYPKVEVEAKSLAEELGIDYLWNDTSFREATKEDGERIQSALDSEEGLHGNGDWSVKLGINLYYSANLSRSPLYSKQMPYNLVIYNAFGRSTPTNSPTKPKISGKGTGKQKKIVVAGKWCGKAWMSNQVHPYLAQRDTQELEYDGSFNARATPDEKWESIPEVSHPTEQFVLSEDDRPSVTIPATRKHGRKRKATLEKGSNKKPKCPQEEPDEIEDDLSENNSAPLCGRILRSGQMKQETTPHLQNNYKRNIKSDSYVKDETEGGPSTRLRKRPSKLPEFVKLSREKQQPRKKRMSKAPANKSDVKDVEAEYQCDMDGCSMSFSSKNDLTLHKRNICSVKGCGKKFFSHKYLVQHRKVHIDDRPLKCPWKGCKMTFKWAWARTEHIRVHTGARPYVCNEAGCGQTFRFVSDFSRHKRKTGHSAKKGR